MKKRNPNDATLRNIRAVKKRLDAISARLRLRKLLRVRPPKK